MAHRIRLVLVTTLLASACGLNVVGIAEPPDASAPDASTHDGALADVVTPAEPEAGEPDASVDAEAPDANVCNVVCGATDAGPAAFGPALMGDGTVDCPAGFTSEDLVENPTAQAGSCGCGTCAPTADCTNGQIQSYDSADNSCSTAAGVINGAGNKCLNYPGHYVSTYASFTAPDAGNPTCTSQGVGVLAQVARTNRRVCKPPPACRGAVCDAPQGFTSCIAATGNMGCPAEFKVQHLLADVTAIQMKCPACSCSVTATCTGSMQWWGPPANNCNGTPNGTLQGGVCTQVDQANITELKWVPGNTVFSACTMTNSATANVTMPPSQTVCCTN